MINEPDNHEIFQALQSYLVDALIFNLFDP
ncbi:predicted protein [Sclerotinia sclerotiorum 1980 UF-70]|uniref:Uncharacterized protein n=1 Tax=Sclerotinia sclerotiorum (strain ATCC 18683 / 1980 / Ss-1) TaxID=665079 RepID=A7F198_SCLS1|nr:predicted protein [Sclerotinia sclerotiorum 1980 UF-70]EDN95490.1 predicted protein [Sclerotinia sclerotiorum 1980 UF-70]